MPQKNKKTKQYFFDEILNVLNKSYDKPLNYKQIAARLEVTDHSQKLLINAVLQDLKERGIVSEPERGQFKIKKTDNYITGTVDMIASGAAFIISEGREEDTFIPPKKMLNAMHGDTVKVYLFPKRKNSKQEGEVVEIIQRARTEFVGTVQLSHRFAFLVPDNNKINTDIFIPLEKINGAKDGQKAIARITEWPKKSANPIGEITDVLGNPGENDVEINSILVEYGLPISFPNNVEKVADLIPVAISEEEIAKRRDFREITTFTIDPLDAKDFDDALSIRKLENGNWEIGVHIADVTHYVKEDSIIDQEALNRATSIYLVDRVVPMLPEILSNNVCSLRPDEEKLCFAAVFEMDDNASILNEWIGRTIIRSNKRFTYEEAQVIIETEEGDFSLEILILDGLAKKLRTERFRKGSIAFEKAEVKFHLDEKGDPTGVYFKEQKDSNKLIEDFMLLANMKVAEFVGKAKKDRLKEKSKKTFVYRIHDSPDQDRLNAFATLVSKFGYKVDTKSNQQIATSFNKLLKDVTGKREANMIEQLAIRTMAKAIYSTKNIGHYGLGFDYYTHFTSPIRRYPDMMVHRLLNYYLEQENEKGKHTQKEINADELEHKCKHSSDMEKKAAEAERASIKYKQVQFLEDKVGEKFAGVISGVTEWGIFVEIIENKCEGMVRLKDISNDHYIFDQESYSIRGSRKGQIYTLGDTITIQVKRADLSRKQLDFLLVTE